MIFNHQQAVRVELVRTIRAFFHAPWRNLPVRPRFNRFITGPTGVGKSTLVREVARETDIPLFEVSATNWIPLGVSDRSARATWIDIADFCKAHKRGIIFLDEADKLGAESAWMNHVRVEIFSLLDQRVPQNLFLKSEDDALGESPEEAFAHVSNKLSHDIFIVGAGAFQCLWEGRVRSSLGFRTPSCSADPGLASRDMHSVIPPEIANRFASPVLQLRPLAKADYLEMAESVASHLTELHNASFRRLANERLDSALSNQSGCRWVEELLLEVITSQYTPKSKPITNNQ